MKIDKTTRGIEQKILESLKIVYEFSKQLDNSVSQIVTQYWSHSEERIN